MQNVFTQAGSQSFIDRINQLTPESQAKWGKMNVGKMLAHCNVTYELVYTDKHPKPNFITKFLIKLFAKPMVVGEKPYPQNGRTAPAFLITDEKDFTVEKTRLIEHIQKTQQLGEAHFDNKESHSMGKLTKSEWNNLFAKHLDHHLRQFGV